MRVSRPVWLLRPHATSAPDARRIDRRLTLEGRVTLLGHPVHQMLVVSPLGLPATSLVFDLAGIATGHADMSTVAYWMLLGGLSGGAVAAPFGFLDWLKIPAASRAKRIGAMHEGGNAVVLACFLASWALRQAPPAAPDGLHIALSLSGAGIVLVTAWLGGELVVRHAVGVHEGAGPEVPGSLASSGKRPHSHAAGS